jgi:membrane glycosyltransferase
LFNRSFFWWNTPIFVPLVLSVPLSVWSSRASVGRGLGNLGLFLIPEEVDPPPELHLLRGSLKEDSASRSSRPLSIKGGFVRAVVDPWVNALHRHLLRNERTVAAATGSRRQGLVCKALARGPKSLSAREKKELLYDRACMHQLHQGVWETPDPNLAEMWGIPP